MHMYISYLHMLYIYDIWYIKYIYISYITGFVDDHGTCCQCHFWVLLWGTKVNHARGWLCRTAETPRGRVLPCKLSWGFGGLSEGSPDWTWWWFQICFIFTPIWGRFPFWLLDYYFSDGLKPPTSNISKRCQVNLVKETILFQCIGLPKAIVTAAESSSMLWQWRKPSIALIGTPH